MFLNVPFSPQRILAGNCKQFASRLKDSLEDKKLKNFVYVGFHPGIGIFYNGGYVEHPVNICEHFPAITFIICTNRLVQI